MKQVAVALSSFLVITLAHAASFDCSKAQSKVEHLVCDHVTLSDLDTRLSARYKISARGSNDEEKAALRKQQMIWLQEVRNRCLDTGCLQKAYIQRLSEFNWVTLHAEDAPLCEDFRSKNNSRIGLIKFRLDEKEVDQADFNFAIQNMDVDGDRVSDQILLFRAGSASKIAPDNSIFTIRLSSTGKQFTKEAQGFYVISYNSKYYLLTDDWLGEEGPLQMNAFLLGRTGIKPICRFECKLPNRQCGSR